MEKRDLYDKNKNKTGEWIYKNDVIPKDSYIIVVTLFLLNDKNQILIEKRSISKGGKYGFISGHPKMNESSIEGIINETYEEIGLKIRNPILINSINGTNAFYDFYVYQNNIDLNDLKLQVEEVDECKCVNIKERR